MESHLRVSLLGREEGDRHRGARGRDRETGRGMVDAGARPVGRAGVVRCLGGPGKGHYPWPTVYQMFTIYPLIRVFLGQFHYNAYTPILSVNSVKCDCVYAFLLTPCPEWGSGGRRFKSSRPDQLKAINKASYR